MRTIDVTNVTKVTDSWWDLYEKGRIAATANPLLNATPGERRFKLAFCELVADGVYPSGRQIWKKLGKDVNRKVNLNGRECRWLAELREFFSIMPCVAFTARRYRDDWQDWLEGKHGGPKYEYRLMRGPKGSLIANPDWVDKQRSNP